MKTRFLSLAPLLLLALGANAQALPAFPGAQGGGTLTIGGRGGTVMEITNLNDSGAGSFRACVTASGPRTCVPRVGGVVPVKSDITVSQPFLTIQGQMAPGGGLVIGDGHQVGRSLNIVTHDVVVRYLTFNVNNPATPVGPDTGTVGIEVGATCSPSGSDNCSPAYNVVLSNISLMMAGNKSVISYTSEPSKNAAIHDVTMQYSIQTLPNVGHPVGCMTDTGAWAYLNVNQDFHHNFFTQFGHRQCLYNTNQGHFVNNLTYNYSDPAAAYGFAMEPQGPSQVDMVGNIWVFGNMNAGNTANPHPVNINATGSSDCTANCWNGATQPSHYMLGNVCAQGTDWQCAAQVTSEGGPETGIVPVAWRRPTPLPAESNPIIADPVTGLDTKILATVGNSQGLNCDGSWNTLHRNAIDAMVIQAYPKGNGALFNQQYPAPTATPGTACPEDPVSHVPTAYLAARGIPAGTSPWKVMPGDTYPLLETYANGSGVTPPPVTTWTGWLGADALTGTPKIGGTVVINANAGPVRSSGCSSTGGAAGPAITPQPTGIVGQTVNVIGGPSPVCSAGVAYWQVTSGSTPAHPNITCTPATVTIPTPSQCTADQQVTWSATLGNISSSGLFTPTASGQAQITGTNANGSGTAPITVQSAPPPVTYPTVSISIGVPPGPVTTLTCTANSSGVYSCK